MNRSIALILVAGLGAAAPASADITNLNIIYNLQLRSSLNHFKEDCRLAINLIEVGQQIGQDGTARAQEVVAHALADLSEKADFNKVDMDVVFKSFLGHGGRKRLIVAGEEVFWINPANHKIKGYMVEAAKAMRVKLFSQANGDKTSAKFNRHFEDIDVLERLVTSIEAEDHVMRNRKGEEIKRSSTKEPPPPTEEDPMIDPTDTPPPAQ